MKKKSSSSIPQLPDIELPLLSSRPKQPNTSSRTRFMEFFNAESSASKYIKRVPFLKFLLLADTWPLIKLSNTQKDSLSLDDLPFPFAFCNVEDKIIALDKEWTASVDRKDPSITKALIKAFKKEIGIAILLGFLLINGKWTTTTLMGLIIRNITNSNFGVPMDYNQTLLFASLLGIVAVSMVFIINWFWHYSAIVSVIMKNALIGYTYRKLQGVALVSLQETNIGKVVNLLSNDVSELERGFPNLIQLFWSPYTITAGAILLWNLFSYATIVGILALTGSLLLSNRLSRLTIPMKTQKKLITDERIKLTNELIECIRLLKMYAWEKPFKQAIEALRNNETVKLMKIRLIEALGRGISDTSSQTSLIIICIIYISIGGVLSPQKVFTGLMMLNFIGFWGVMFPKDAIMFLSSFKVIKARFENLLLVKDIEEVEEIGQALRGKEAVVFHNFSAWWKKDEPKPCLNNINLNLYPNQLTTVIGSIGAGKTSFLLSILREIPITQGELSIKGTMAYVEQEPIIFSGTIRSNILFGLEYDDLLYKRVIRACNLHADLQEFEDGDMAIVGERGITLSGGQKARLSLARALYSQSDIYLLDDPLSAVDSKVGRHIFNYAIKGDLLKGKTVVLVTHHINFAKESDRVLFFSEGQIAGDGPFTEISSMGSTLFDKFKEIEDEAEKRKSSLSKASTSKGASEVLKNKTKQETGKNGYKEEANSEVTWSTYTNYIKESDDFASMVLLLVVSVLYGCLGIGLYRFLGYWAQAHSSFYFEVAQNGNKESLEDFDNTPYIITAGAITLLLVVGGSFQMVLTGNFLIKINTNIHNKILNKIIQAQTLFFDRTPIGVILNRFTNDLGVLDSDNALLLPPILDNTFYICFRILAVLFYNPWIVFPLVAVVIALNNVKAFFKKGIIEVRRIHLISKSPLYSEISATINGLLAIRTFRQGGTFIRKFCDLVYNNTRASLYTDRTLRFFSIMSMITLESLTVMGTFACVILAHHVDVDAAVFGLILVMLQEIAMYGTWYQRTSLLVDVNMQSVERMFQLYEIEQEKSQSNTEGVDSATGDLKGWPDKGQIVFQNVYMKYRPEFDYVLKGLTFSITGGEKVGVVGRTGAGKSSIIQALFRMTEIDHIPGGFIRIDGVDISKIGLNILRNSISIIPQTPVVFTGTIRRNLDPFNKFTDNDLWEVLREVNLKDYVATLEKKLETDMTMSSSVFSAGQKQLICLARAILRKSKIIVLDEATANVDIETDDFIQRKIMEKFRDSTVITIAHRLITIANYDKVLVMDKGCVVEYNNPYHLMVKNEGDQSITRTGGLFAQMVVNSGESMAKKIFQVSYKRYIQN